MGDVAYKVDEFSPEELAALGEAEGTPAPAADDKKAEQTEETKGTETPLDDGKTSSETEQTGSKEKPAARFEDGYVIDEDGEKIPLKRFKEIYREAKDGERARERYDLMKKVGQEEFFQLFPDEAPQGWKPKQEPKTDISSLVAQYPDSGHQYHGMTLGEINKIDPLEAYKLLEGWKSTQSTIESARAKNREETKAQTQREAEEFAKAVASDVFGKADLTTLEPDEVRQINELIKDTYSWGLQNGKKGYSISDMWALRQKTSAAISRQKQEKALKSLDEPGAPFSIGSGGGSADPGGFAAYEAMSETQLINAIDRMRDKEATVFFKKAPPSLRKKYPAIPWG